MASPRLWNRKVFGTALRPGTPLVLRRDQWEALAASREAITRRDRECDDHGSEFQWDVKLRAENGRIDATRVSYACKGAGKLGPPVEVAQ